MVGQQPDGHASGAQEAIELGRGRVFPGAGGDLGLVEVETGGEGPDEHFVGGTGAAGGGGVVGEEIPLTLSLSPLRFACGARGPLVGGFGLGLLSQGEGGAEVLAAFGDVEG